ncbi:MAG: phosphoribosylglycinamide formyltransferase [Candidatus Cloacimonadota bacterium]|nr:MAG: phosphoribosylglycinamide formyltransferase [Candidatus Cloacimonadota bacterium]PIE77771.1 MAG: phosphoribosylglycinamide formyltransferase [Candidatus Delongbacteria bacterium]
MKSFNICAYISGSGSNLKAILKSIELGKINSRVVAVISSKKDAKGLEYPKSLGIETAYINRKEMGISGTDFALKQISLLKKHKVDLIVLAGYMKKISPKVLESFEGRIINIHPALLPNYGGKGMYGMNVHNKVFENGEKVSGATIHYVNDKYDDGDIILSRSVDISNAKSPEEIQKTVLKIEHILYSDAIKKLENNG